MIHDDTRRNNDYTVIPIASMINAGSVIFFGEDPGVIGNLSDEYDDKEETIRKLSR